MTIGTSLKQFSLKQQLGTLIVLAVLFLSGVMALGMRGIQAGVMAVNEVGRIRLPSVDGLAMIQAGQYALTMRILETAIWENDYQAQQHFNEVLHAKAEAWAMIQKGWQRYEPLPQTAEEARLWQQFLPAWRAWQQRPHFTLGDLTTTPRLACVAAARPCIECDHRSFGDGQCLAPASASTFSPVLSAI